MKAKNAAYLFGVVFVLVGVLGFLGGFGIVGPTGLFATDTAHNFVHLISGIVFLIVAGSAPHLSAKTLMTFGVVYALVAVLGFMADGDHVAGILINNADNYLHVVLAAATFFTGYALRDDARTVRI